MTSDLHANEPDPGPCPPWCADQDYEGTPNHPDRHSTHPLGVDAEDAAGSPVEFFALGVEALLRARCRVVLGRGDEDYVRLTASASRSLAAALVRLADVIEFQGA